MFKAIFGFSLGLVLMCNTLISQNQGNLQTIGIPDGLSSPNVTNVYQDRFGYMWIMTEDGLNRYDGTKIKIYRNDPDDPNSLFNNSTYCAVEDMDGYLWVGGTGVVSRYDYATESFEAVTLNSASSMEKDRIVRSLFADSKGRIWCGTAGGTIHKLDTLQNHFEAMYYSENENMTSGSSVIWDITELKNGKVLISDYSYGIYQFDESSGKFFNFYLSDNYSPINIIRIQEDDNGLIWFLGTNKVIRYNPAFYSYEILPELEIQKPLHFIGFQKVSEENYVFVCEPFGIIRYNPKTSKVIETIRTNLAPFWYASDKFGILWIAASGGLIKYDPNREPFTHVSFNTITSQDNRNSSLNYLLLDKFDKETAWLLSSDNKLIKYGLQSNSMKYFNISLPDSFQQRVLDRFIQDRDGNFLLGSTTSPGIFKYDVRNEKLTRTNLLSNTFDFGSNIRSMSFGQNNSLYAASTRGLLYYDLTSQKRFILPTISNRKYSKETERIVEDALKNASELALITEADETKSYHIDFSIENNSFVLIRCLGEGRMDDRTNNLIWDYGVLRDERGEIVFEMQDYFKTFYGGGGEKNRIQYAVLELEKGKYKLDYNMDGGHSFNNFNAPPPNNPSYYGIQLYNIKEDSYKSIKKQLPDDLSDTKYLPLEYLIDVEVSRKFSNSLYLCSDTQGLFRFNTQDSSYTHYTFGNIEKGNQKNKLQSCYEDIAGNVWVSTAQGLILLNPDNGKWRVFTEKDGLPSNNILESIEGQNGDLWIISLGGLSKFNKNSPENKWNFVNYDTRDGLTGYSFNGAPVKTPEGEIIFVVGDGLLRFTPGTSNPIKPDVVISDLKISDISVFDPESSIKLTNSLLETEGVSLPFNMNDLSFNFNVIHFSRPYKNRLFYKMEGYNENWIESELGTATYTNLDPGTYVFKVRGISADGIRNDEGASIKIEISPPWWKTTFAYVGYFFLFGGVIFSVDRVQRRRVLVKERAANAIKEADLRVQLAEAENERKSIELEEARELQLSMLPKELPSLSNLDIAVYMKTATEVGGDYYDFNVSLDGTLTVVLGDATGHGMKAGTMVTTTKSLFNVLAPNPNIVETFHEMTRCFKMMHMDNLSMCLIMLKIMGNKLQMSAAGMPSVFIYKREESVIEEHVMKGMPLGTMKDFPYIVKESQLNIGDTILLMSDGLPELRNNSEEEFGYKRVRNVFEEHAVKTPEEIIVHLKDAGSNWINDKDPEDDVTLVVIKVK